jgi:mannose-6-phosphate isomerase-like protein (cupin superfamily)
MSGSHTTREGEGEVIDLGMATMRLLASSDVSCGGFTLSEFAGGEGRWSVVHIHERFEESFLVLKGQFTFVAGDEEIEADPARTSS